MVVTVTDLLRRVHYTVIDETAVYCLGKLPDKTVGVSAPEIIFADCIANSSSVILTL